MHSFDWNRIQHKEDGKILLLWRHERIFKEGLVSKGTRVMDVGGWGHLTERVIQEGGYPLVFDLFTNDQYYPDRVRESSWFQGDITDPAVVSIFFDYFNVVCCFETLEHIEDQKAAIHNMYECLLPGGWIVGTVPIPGFSHKEDEPVFFLYPDKLSSLLQEVGFTDILIEPTPSINKTDPECSSWYFKGRKL